MSVPPQPSPDWPPGNIAPASTPAAHADAGRPHVENAARLMLGQDAGDVIVDDDHFIDMRLPLLGEHADRRRAAADPHARFLCRRSPGLAALTTTSDRRRR